MKTYLMMALCLALVSTGAFATAVKPKLAEGDPAPAFDLASTGGRARLSDFKGKWLVMYFYVKAMTPPAVKEAVSLREGYTKIKKMDAEVVGVSRDDLETLHKFKKGDELPFDLLSDPDKATALAYDVVGFGGMYQRRTFLIDPKGNVAHIFYSVTVNQHAEEVVDALRKYQAEAGE